MIEKYPQRITGCHQNVHSEIKLESLKEKWLQFGNRTTETKPKDIRQYSKPKRYSCSSGHLNLFVIAPVTFQVVTISAFAFVGSFKFFLGSLALENTSLHVMAPSSMSGQLLR